MDIDNCETCRQLVFKTEDSVRDELGLPVIKRSKRRCSEFGIDFNNISGIESLLTLKWDWLSTSLKNQIRSDAKEKKEMWA